MNSFETTFNAELYTETLSSKMPRYYQIDAVEKVAEYLEEGYRRIQVQGPTGCGKTLTSKLVTVSKRVRNAIGFKGEVLRVLFISNRHRLNRQAMEEFSGCSTVELIPHSAFSKLPESVIENGWDLVLIDESHHEAMSSLQLLLDKLTTTPIIGFTADPSRGDGLLCKFDRVVVMISESEAADRGFIEKAGINTILDYSGKDKKDLAVEIVRNYGHCMGNTIVFFRTSNEVRDFHEDITKMGYTAGYLDEKSTETDMDRLLDALSSGEIQFLINCSKVGEGIDTPNVTDVMLMRSFNSRAEKKQYIGRAIRSDSQCSVWELMNPLVRAVSASDCVGRVKYTRIINKHKGVWSEKLSSGEDLTWGQMSVLRVQPDESREQSLAKAAELQALSGDIDNDYVYESGGALSMVEMGINVNINAGNRNFNRAGSESLTRWLELNTQMDMFDVSSENSNIRVRKRKQRKKAA